MPRRDVDRVVKVVALDQCKPADLFFTLDEWPIADQRLAIARLHLRSVDAGSKADPVKQGDASTI
jgi:hypothetical protein